MTSRSSLSSLIDRLRPLVPAVPPIDVSQAAVDEARHRAAEHGISLESFQHRVRASRLAALSFERGVMPENHFCLCVASLTLALGPRPLVHELGPGVAEAADTAGVHILPERRPRLLEQAFLIESIPPERGGVLFDDTWCLGGYVLDEVFYLCGFTSESRGCFASWRPRWGGGTVGEGAGEDLIVSADTRIADPGDELRAWARRAAHFALALGLMLDGEGTPLRSREERPRLSGPRGGKPKSASARGRAWTVRHISLAGPVAAVGASPGKASPGRPATAEASPFGRHVAGQPFEPFSLHEGALLEDGKRGTIELLHLRLYPVLADRDRLIERLRHDIALVKKLECPEFVTYDRVVVTGQGRIGLVLPEGITTELGTLAAPAGAYGRPWLEPAVAYAAMRRVLSALVRLHGIGLAHRHLAPDAILTAPGQIKILHAGLGDALAEGMARQAKGKLVLYGSPRYLAPEMYRDPDKADGRADLYSAGVIFYELLAGHHPGFVDDKHTPRPEVAELYLRNESLPPIGQFVPAYANSALERLLQQATSFDPAKRVQTAHEFSEALGNLWRTFTSADIVSHLAAERDAGLVDKERVETMYVTEAELARILTSGEYELVSVRTEGDKGQGKAGNDKGPAN